MKLSQWAKKQGISYQTAWNMHKSGKLASYQLPTGTIIVREERAKNRKQKVAVYARVSSSQNRKNLETQAERLIDYCIARGWTPEIVVKEIGSGLNDHRKRLEKLLLDDSITHIVVEHKDRFSRFGMHYIKLLLEKQGRKIVIVNPTVDDKEDLMQDFVSIITSFTARLYGQRRSKRKTEKIIKELKANDSNPTVPYKRHRS